MKKQESKGSFSLRVTCSLFTFGLLAIWVLAGSADVGIFTTKYTGTKLGTCSLCHTTVPAVNPYGADYKTAGRNAAALATIEGKDSDGDGFTNLQEIQAGTFPGDPNSKPALVFTNTLEFAHFVVGGTWRSFLVLNSLAAGDVTINVDFTGQDGKSLAVEVNGAASKSSYSTTIPKDGFLKLGLGLSGTANSKSGWVKVSATGNVGGMLVYQYLNNTTVNSQATVLPSNRMKKFRMSLPQLGVLTDSGLAFANVSANPNQVTLRYYTPDGKVAAATGTQSLTAGQQVAQMVWQFISSFPPTQEGVLEVSSTEELIAVGLQGVNSWNAFTTVPLVAAP